MGYEIHKVEGGLYLPWRGFVDTTEYGYMGGYEITGWESPECLEVMGILGLTCKGVAEGWQPFREYSLSTIGEMAQFLGIYKCGADFRWHIYSSLLNLHPVGPNIFWMDLYGHFFRPYSDIQSSLFIMEGSPVKPKYTLDEIWEDYSKDFKKRKGWLPWRRKPNEITHVDKKKAA